MPEFPGSHSTGGVPKPGQGSNGPDDKGKGTTIQPTKMPAPSKPGQAGGR